MLKHADQSLVDQWLSRYPPNTQRNYRNDLYAFLTFLQKKRLAKVAKDDIVTFLDSSPTPTLRHRRLSVIKTFYVDSAGLNQISANPALSIPRQKPLVSVRSYRSVDPDAVIKILEAATKLRDKVLIQLVYSCALTANEILNLKWSDCKLDKKGGIINVPGAKSRTLSISGRIVNDLIKLRATKRCTDLVIESRFGKNLCERQINRILSEIGFSVGVENVSTRSLRNAYAQHALANGIPLSEVHYTLGLKSLKSTALRLQPYIPTHNVSLDRGTQGNTSSVPIINANTELREEDFESQLAELAKLEALAKPSLALRKRRNNLRLRLALEVERRIDNKIPLPTEFANLPRYVLLSHVQIRILSLMLAEARTVLDMKTQNALDRQEALIYMKQVSEMTSIQSILDRYKVAL